MGKKILCWTCKNLVKNPKFLDCKKANLLDEFELISFYQDELVYECKQYKKKVSEEK